MKNLEMEELIMSNFEFLKSFEIELFNEVSKAETQYIAKTYDIAIQTLRKFTEGMILYAAKKEGFPSRKNLSARIEYMLQVDYINKDLFDMLSLLKNAGNKASHYNQVEFDRQDVLTRLQDAFFIARWLYNRYNIKKIHDDFDSTKLEKKKEFVKEKIENKGDMSNVMTKLVKHFFDISAVNGPSEETPGKNSILEIKVDNRTIPYMVLLRKFRDKVSNALYPAIYIYKNFGVAFTVYGKGGYCKDDWPRQIEKKTTIESYFKKSGQYDDVLSQNPKYNYFDNMYENVYELSKLNEEAYKLITEDFEKIRLDLKKLREEIL